MSVYTTNPAAAVKIYANPRSDPEYVFPAAGLMDSGWSGGMESMSEGTEYRVDIDSRKWATGGVVTGDRLVGPRSITVAGVLQGPTRAQTAMEINKMKNACYRPNHNFENGWLQLTQYSQSPYNQVYKISGVSRFGVEWITSTAAEITVQFALADPFRYDRWTTQYPASSPYTTLILNSGNNYRRTTTITLPDDVAYTQIPQVLVQKYAGEMDSLIYRNLSAYRPSYANTALRMDGLQMTVTGSGEYRNLYIDSEAATVDKVIASDQGSISGTRIDYTHTITSGDFPWLQPGDNEIEFYIPGASVPVGLRIFVWIRKRYL